MGSTNIKGADSTESAPFSCSPYAVCPTLKGMQVNVQYAREHLEDLIASAQQGEEVEIARDGQPLAKLIVMPVKPETASQGERILGAGRGELRIPSDEEWKAMDKELEDLMLNGPLFPDEAK